MPRKILLMYSTHQPGPAHIAALAALGEGINVFELSEQAHD